MRSAARREDIRLKKKLMVTDVFRSRNAHRRRIRDVCLGKDHDCWHVEVSDLRINKTEMMQARTWLMRSLACRAGQCRLSSVTSMDAGMHLCRRAGPGHSVKAAGDIMQQTCLHHSDSGHKAVRS